MTASTLRARAAAFFVEPRTPTVPPGDLADLVPLVRRDPPPRPSATDGPPSSTPRGAPRADLARPAHLVRHDPPPVAGPAAPIAPRLPIESPLRVGSWADPAPVAAGVRVFSPPAPPIGSAPRAAVLGRAADAVPCAAALACALRVAHGSSAAVVATWIPDDVRHPAPRGPGAPGASRVAARLSARGLAATAQGRLAWLPLSEHVVAASVAARRASAVLDVPLVLALAGSRCDVVEALLREQDLVIVVAGDPDAPLARLAVAGCTVPATARRPLSATRRMLAMAGHAIASDPGWPR